MLKKVEWREDDVYSLRLRDDLYTLVQMRKNHLMQFFDLRRAQDDWQNVTLDACPTLFFKFVAVTGLKRLFSRKLGPSQVLPSTAPIETKVLSMDLSQASDYSARLVELTDAFGTIGARELTGRLNIRDDLDTIYRYELCGSEGSADKMAKRLVRYFETGVSWDDSKEFLWKGIAPPPAHYGQENRRREPAA